ncbi:Cysteine dioxygenase [Cichlidogyrus casuarinus]|uniref:Cysteine dioxygenase n=1 Tax=Cichlidogyrus casuarinus TaxID=1844966 RepID=A0ABD2QIJ1_9PLAT
MDVLNSVEANLSSDMEICAKSPSKLSMEELIRELHRVFEKDEVSVDELHQLMSSVDLKHENWEKYEYFDQYRYTRNLVDEGNGKFNLIVLCWGLRHGSGIHDHMGSHCLVTVLSGECKEDLYDWPEKSSSGALQEMKLRSSQIHKPGEVNYIHDKIGLHRIENPSHTNKLVTLHLYCPPYSECHNFNENTSQAHSCTVTFMTKYGKRPDRRSIEVSFYSFTIHANSQIFEESH